MAIDIEENILKTKTGANLLLTNIDYMNMNSKVFHGQSQGSL